MSHSTDDALKLPILIQSSGLDLSLIHLFTKLLLLPPVKDMDDVGQEIVQAVEVQESFAPDANPRGP